VPQLRSELECGTGHHIGFIEKDIQPSLVAFKFFATN
jgi:hypothetical protein